MIILWNIIPGRLFKNLKGHTNNIMFSVDICFLNLFVFNKRRCLALSETLKSLGVVWSLDAKFREIVMVKI